MDLDECIRHALDGRAILFVGSGFSAAAQNSAGQDLPTGGGLAKLLAAELKLASQPSLDLVAEMYKQRVGETKLIQLIKDRFSAATVTKEQEVYTALPWRRIYTTNYDNVIELASAASGKKLGSLTLLDDPRAVAPGQRYCIHINGFVEALSNRGLDSDLMLTNSSYLSDSFNASRWSRFFREDVEIATSVLFVGYSLYDLDIARVLHASPEIQRKCCFIVSDSPSEELRFSLERFGTVLSVGTVSGAETIARISEGHIPSAGAPIFRAFRKFELTDPSAKTIRDRDVFNLYALGQFDTDLLPQSLREDDPDYYVSRAEIGDIMNRIDNGERVIALHSYLANGKTMLAKGIAYAAIKNSYAVFEFDRERHTLSTECDAIARTTKKIIAIIEDYNRHISVIERLLLTNNPLLSLIVTSRTPIHIMEWKRLVQIVSPISPIEVDIDQLSDVEVSTLDRIFERHGLLGADAKKSRQSRLGFLRGECRGEFRDILLHYLDSEHIQTKVNGLLESLRQTPGVFEVVIGALVLRHIGWANDIDLLAELTGVAKINRALFARDPNVAEMLNVSQRNVVATSGIFATHALRSFWSSGLVTKQIAQMLGRALELRADSPEYGKIARELMRFSRIAQLIPPSNHAAELVEYYESIRNFGGCAGNQFFWLQYAIARIDIKDYALAERFLETAFALASKIAGFSTFQIDNTKARLLLKRAMDLPEKYEPFASFKDANRILLSQMRQGIHGFYPFRVASLYGKFWSDIARQWPEGQKEIFIAAARSVRQRLDSIDRHIASHADVRRCGEEIDRLLAEAKQ